jgi:hypothetical protein
MDRWRPHMLVVPMELLDLPVLATSAEIINIVRVYQQLMVDLGVKHDSAKPS